jgi:hypothetical protein
VSFRITSNIRSQGGRTQVQTKTVRFLLFEGGWYPKDISSANQAPATVATTRLLLALLFFPRTNHPRLVNWARSGEASPWAVGFGLCGWVWLQMQAGAF